MWPVAPDRCRGFLDYFFAPELPEDFITGFLAFDDQVGAEDTALVEGVQAGAGSGLVESGRLLAYDEQLVAHFQAYVRTSLADPVQTLFRFAGRPAAAGRVART